jgi:hypothetical protein
MGSRIEGMFLGSNSKFIDHKCKFCDETMDLISSRDTVMLICFHEDFEYTIHLSKRFAKIEQEYLHFDELTLCFNYYKKKYAILLYKETEKLLPYRKFKKLSIDELMNEIKRYSILI